MVDGKVRLRRGIGARSNIFLHRQTGGLGLLRDLGLYLLLVVLQALIKVGKLRRLRQRFPLIEKRAALLYIVHKGGQIGGLLWREGIAGLQKALGFLFHTGKGTVLLHIRDKLIEKHFPLGLVRLPCLRPLVVQHMVFPAFILRVVFVIPLDMLDQGTVSVAKILPPLVVVRLALHSKINAELGFIVPMTCITRLFPVMALGLVQ